MDNSSISFINNHDNWPHWPVLPMERRTAEGMPTVGIIHISNRLQVVEGLNIFGGWGKEEWEAAPKHDYPTVEALVADGWEVD